MTEKEFRVMHSELIEYYQLIEWRLGVLCATILADEERNWFERLNDYEYDSFGLLMHKISEIQEQQHLQVLKPTDLKALHDLRKKRNYWVHQCFVDNELPIVFNGRGELKRPHFAKKLKEALRDAIDWDEKLTEVARGIRISPIGY